MYYYNKYLKYKHKYLSLKKNIQYGGHVIKFEDKLTLVLEEMQDIHQLISQLAH